MQNNLLKDRVLIKRQFQKSVRLNADLQDEHALDGYVPLASSMNTLNQMCHAIVNHKSFAFTWTGPYGSGKSTLALLFASLCSENPQLQSKALSFVDSYKDNAGQNYILKMFQDTDSSSLINSEDEQAESSLLDQETQTVSLGNSYQALCLVGCNQPLRQVLTQLLLNKFSVDKLQPFLSETVNTSEGAVMNTDSSILMNRDTSEILQAVVDYLQSIDQRLILVVDELGKFLQNAIHDHDIYFLQEIAEIAGRSQGRLIFLGILHQSFDSYIQNFDKQVRDEWVKVQGRFENQILHPSSFEILNLIGASLEKQDYTPVFDVKPFSELVFSNYPFQEQIQETLNRCLPLHPLSAMLLSALSLKTYGQNERSIFGFMNSYEPHSFMSFLNEHHSCSERLYMPDDLFDYVMVNQQMMLIHSSDGHQFTQALDILHNLENSCSLFAIRLFKTMVMINMFGNKCQISATPELLELMFPDITKSIQIDLLEQSNSLQNTARTLCGKPSLELHISSSPLNLQQNQDSSLEEQTIDSVAQSDKDEQTAGSIVSANDSTDDTTDDSAEQLLHTNDTTSQSELGATQNKVASTNSVTTYTKDSDKLSELKPEDIVNSLSKKFYVVTDDLTNKSTKVLVDDWLKELNYGINSLAMMAIPGLYKVHSFVRAAVQNLADAAEKSGLADTIQILSKGFADFVDTCNAIAKSNEVQNLIQTLHYEAVRFDEAYKLWLENQSRAGELKQISYNATQNEDSDVSSDDSTASSSVDADASLNPDCDFYNYNLDKVSAANIKLAKAKFDQSQELLDLANTPPSYSESINALSQKKAVIYRNYNNTFNSFGGSDFDFEAEFKQQYASTILDFKVLESLYEEDHIILAKRHYMQTGNQRYMNIQLIQSKNVLQIKPYPECGNDKFGTIYLTFIEEGFNLKSVLTDLLQASCKADNIVFAVVPNSQQILQQCKEFQALKKLSAKVEHLGDKIAKQELHLHTSESQRRLQEQLILSLKNSIVIHDGSFVNAPMQKTATEFFKDANNLASANDLSSIEPATSDKQLSLNTSMSQSLQASNEDEDRLLSLCNEALELYQAHKLQPCNFISLASNIADHIFYKAPFLRNELINHNKLSTNISAARNKLLKAMCEHSDEFDLGFVKAPPEACIYWTLFKQYGMHRINPLANPDETVNAHNQKADLSAADLDTALMQGSSTNETQASADNDYLEQDESSSTQYELEGQSAKAYQFYFDHEIDERYYQLFSDTLKHIQKNKGISVSEIYTFWSGRPYGIKKGLLPVLMLYFILVTQDQIAAYNNNSPLIDLSGEIVDDLLVNPELLTFKYIKNLTQNTALLQNIYLAISHVSPQVINATCSLMNMPLAFTVEQCCFKANALANPTAMYNPLFLSRALVRFVLRQKSLTLNTPKLSNRCMNLRAFISTAYDPVKLLFEDLTELYPDLSNSSTELEKDLSEIGSYYQNKLFEVHDILLKSIKHDPSEPLTYLNERAVNIKGLGAELELKNFINKLCSYKGDISSIERLINGCTNTPIKNLSETDVQNAKMAIQKLAFEFRKTEGFAAGQGLKDLRKFISFTTTSSEHGDLTEIIELDEHQQVKVNDRAEQMLDGLIANLSYNEALGVLAKLADLMQKHYK